MYVCMYVGRCVCVPSCSSRVQLYATLWTVACQAPLSMGFSRQEYWSGLLCPPPGDLPDPGTEPESLNISCTGRQILYHHATWKACMCVCIYIYMVLNHFSHV